MRCEQPSSLPEVVPLDCKAAATTNFPITTYQPKYFGAPNLDGAKHLVDDFCESLPRVIVDRDRLQS